MSREAYDALSPEEQKRIDDGLEGLNEELQQIMRLVRQDERSGTRGHTASSTER